MTRRDWLRSKLALVTGSAMAEVRPTGDAAGLAGPPGIALAASREGPPRTVKAAYLSYYGIGDRTIRSHVLGLLDRTELNAVVIVGQRIEELCPLVDVLSPMAYPSAYHLGIPNYRDPSRTPTRSSSRRFDARASVRRVHRCRCARGSRTSVITPSIGGRSECRRSVSR